MTPSCSRPAVPSALLMDQDGPTNASARSHLGLLEPLQEPIRPLANSLPRVLRRVLVLYEINAGFAPDCFSASRTNSAISALDKMSRIGDLDCVAVDLMPLNGSIKTIGKLGESVWKIVFYRDFFKVMLAQQFGPLFH